jgi:hypothetical protein
MEIAPTVAINSAMGTDTQMSAPANLMMIAMAGWMEAHWLTAGPS